VRQGAKDGSPLKGNSGETVTSARSSSSAEREEEECKLGIEDDEGISGASELARGETDE
jgi:hypothetical protein